MKRDEDIPLAFICATQSHSTFVVWPGNIRGEIPDDTTKQILRLNPGDIIVFRGDLIHAGGAYAKRNVRVHFFIESKKVPSDANTWIPDEKYN